MEKLDFSLLLLLLFAWLLRLNCDICRNFNSKTISPIFFRILHSVDIYVFFMLKSFIRFCWLVFPQIDFEFSSECRFRDLIFYHK